MQLLDHLNQREITALMELSTRLGVTFENMVFLITGEHSATGDIVKPVLDHAS